jgi:hypothetical protein
VLFNHVPLKVDLCELCIPVTLGPYGFDLDRMIPAKPSGVPWQTTVGLPKVRGSGGAHERADALVVFQGPWDVGVAEAVPYASCL